MTDRAGDRASYGVDAPRLLLVPAVLVVAGVVQGSSPACPGRSSARH
ncbi:hypothetical protein GXW82_13460 [Streptacidiphilus sp. 4-A2]|nr:hypothetical protein [Streptacidiphilus sp. 4-A2]